MIKKNIYENQIDILEILQIFYKGKIKIAIVIIVSIICAIFIHKSQPTPSVKAEITIEPLSQNQLLQFDLINSQECRIKLLESETIKGGHTIIVDGEDDTLGSIIQSHIVNNYIESDKEDSPIMFCGYKRKHPLEERIMFTIKMKTEDLKIIVVLFKRVCLELEDIVGEILKESRVKLKI